MNLIVCKISKYYFKRENSDLKQILGYNKKINKKTATFKFVNGYYINSKRN